MFQRARAGQTAPKSSPSAKSQPSKSSNNGKVQSKISFLPSGRISTAVVKNNNGGTPRRRDIDQVGGRQSDNSQTSATTGNANANTITKGSLSSSAANQTIVLSDSGCSSPIDIGSIHASGPSKLAAALTRDAGRDDGFDNDDDDAVGFDHRRDNRQTTTRSIVLDPNTPSHKSKHWPSSSPMPTHARTPASTRPGFIQPEQHTSPQSAKSGKSITDPISLSDDELEEVPRQIQIGRLIPAPAQSRPVVPIPRQPLQKTVQERKNQSQNQQLSASEQFFLSQPLQSQPKFRITDGRSLSRVGSMKREREDVHHPKSPANFSGKDEDDHHRGGTGKSASVTHTSTDGIALSAEQEYILSQVVDRGRSVFFTGSAGTGKSVLLRELIKHLKKKHTKSGEQVAVTASTGLAACNIGGVTLHSYTGIGLGKDKVGELIKRIRKGMHRQRWQQTKVLVIDEVSMLDGELFDKLEEIGRTIRGNALPFGGIQLVVTGDFFQLPPVPDRSREVKFAFEATTWSRVFHHTIRLTQVFRQKDPVFAGMLNEMREGRMTPQSIQNFHMLSRPLQAEGSVQATELFPTRREVDLANIRRMQDLEGMGTTFTAQEGGSIRDDAMRTKMLDNFMAPHALALKINAQVMLIKNVDEDLVNGSVGFVRAFMTPAEWLKRCGGGGGESSDSVEAMGGFSSNNNFWLGRDGSSGMPPATAGVDPSEALPVVRFRIASGVERDLLCLRETWNVELPTGEIQAWRRQVPLILAWALSIHKAQGQTIDFVKVDLGKVFERGQAYVALSRATTMAGLQVVRFDPSKVMAHERVKDFYLSLGQHGGDRGSRAGPGSSASASEKAGWARLDNSLGAGGGGNFAKRQRM